MPHSSLAAQEAAAFRAMGTHFESGAGRRSFCGARSALQTGNPVQQRDDQNPHNSDGEPLLNPVGR